MGGRDNDDSYGSKSSSGGYGSSNKDNDSYGSSGNTYGSSGRDNDDSYGSKTSSGGYGSSNKNESDSYGTSSGGYGSSKRNDDDESNTFVDKIKDKAGDFIGNKIKGNKNNDDDY